MAGQRWVVRSVAVALAALAAWTAPQPARAGGAVERPTIIGGTVAPDGRWPFVVGLVRAAEPDNYAAQFCAGSLVHRYYVLTAAHCVEGMRPKGLKILVGTQHLGAGGRRVPVARIHVHRNYDPATADRDVALVRLAEPVDGIRPVNVISLTAEPRRVVTGTPAMVMGWGDTDIDPGFARYPKRMHEVGVSLVARTACNAVEAYDGAVTPRMICAGPLAGGKDTCQGDSGGPLVVRDNRGRFRLQAGIVSWGNGCAEAGFPGVYTRVAHFSDWIGAIIRSGR